MKQSIFLALDLELNQPSGKLIEVGVCIGDIQTTFNNWEVKNWLLDPGEDISPFITELTGITNVDISENAVPLSQMVMELSELIEKHKPFVNPVTWGGGDVTALLELIRSTGADFPYFGRRWIDVKTVFTFLKMTSPNGFNHKMGLKSAMQSMNLTFIGTPHRASRDAFNTLLLWKDICHRQESRNTLIAQLAKT